MALANHTPTAENLPGALVVSAQQGGMEVVDQLADEWRILCEEAANDQPFYRPEWIRAYLRSFVPEAKVLLITARLDNRLCLVLPLVEEVGTLGKIPVRKLRAPVNCYAGRFDAIRRSGSDGDAAVYAVWDYLKELQGWDVLQLRDAPDGSMGSQLATAARAGGFWVIQQPDKPSPYVPVPTDPDLLKQMPLNSRLRRELRQVRRQLADQGSLSFYRVDAADPDALDRFYQLEASGWKGQEGSAILNKGTRPFFDEIAASAARFGYFSLYMLELSGQLLAAHYGFTHHSCYYSAMVAYNEDFKQFSPGHLIISEIVRDCAARGVREFDTTGQNQEWKMKWTNQARPVSHCYIFRGLRGGLAYAIAAQVKPTAQRLLAKRRNIA